MLVDLHTLLQVLYYMPLKKKKKALSHTHTLMDALEATQGSVYYSRIL